VRGTHPLNLLVNEPIGQCRQALQILPGETRRRVFAILDMSDAAAEPNVVELDCYYSLSSPWAHLVGPQPRDIVPGIT